MRAVCNLEVPANAVFVIEGYVDPTEPLRDEGPFGDHTGYYTLPEPYPVFHVTAITHRKDAVYPATIVGASVKLFLPIFKMNFPEIWTSRCGEHTRPRVSASTPSSKPCARDAGSVSEGADRCTRGACAPHCANTDPQRDSLFTKGPSDVLDQATSEIAIGTKLGIDATRKLAGEGFKRRWPPLIKMDEAVRKKIDALYRK